MGGSVHIGRGGGVSTANKSGAEGGAEEYGFRDRLRAGNLSLANHIRIEVSITFLTSLDPRFRHAEL